MITPSNKTEKESQKEKKLEEDKGITSDLLLFA
jgi:hypothetical protein